MKNIFNVILISALFSACSSKKSNSIIPYFLNIDTEKNIYKKIQKFEQEDVVFYLEIISKNSYKLHLIKSKGEEDFMKTNRKLFINDRFYPIIFETDYNFFIELKKDFPVVTKFRNELDGKGEKINIPPIEIRDKERDLFSYPKKQLILDNSIFWLIDNRGKIINQ